MVKNKQSKSNFSIKDHITLILEIRTFIRNLVEGIEMSFFKRSLLLK